MKTSNSVSDEKMKEDSKETSSERYRKGSKSRARPVHHFGEYPGAPFGTTWKNRKECFYAGVHRQLEPGIHGIHDKGAFSIVVSGQYKDDKDYGDTILYTGSGGCKLGDRTREQVCDQQWWDTGNEALRKSSETGKPVRVIRGFELGSVFAPWEGFRYDGLYICKAVTLFSYLHISVTTDTLSSKAWKEKNRDGYYNICRYTMERIPGQPPLRRRSTTVGYYMPLPGSEAVQPSAPAPAPVTGRQRIRQWQQTLLNNDASFLGISP